MPTPATHHRPSHALLATLVVIATLTAACGSTVQTTGTSAAGAVGVDGLSVPAGGELGIDGQPITPGPLDAVGQPLSATGQESAAGTSENAAGTGAGVGTGGTSSQSGSGPGTSSGDGRVGARTWPGLTATTINIGYYYVNTAAMNSAVEGTGAEGSSAGDYSKQVQAVANWLNARGGIAGRKIRLVGYEANINDPVAVSGQAACDHWTQDNKVYAGIGAGPSASDETLLSCMAKRGALALSTAYDVGDQAMFDRYRPHYFAPASLDYVTAAREYVMGLGSGAFFPRDAKVGLLTYDAPVNRRAVDRGVRPTLTRLGVGEPEVAYLRPPSSLSDQATLVSAIQSSVLRFRSEGVTHVLFLDGNASISYFFIQQAESQGYKPRYGFSTLSYPSFLQANFGPEQLRGSLGVGWSPTQDVGSADLPPNAARSQCQEIQNAAGNRPASQPDLTIQLQICSQFFFLKEALSRSSSGVTPTDFAAAASKIGGTTATAAYSLGDSYSPGKPWGAAVVRSLAYVEACSCFRYTGGPRSITR